MHHLTGWRCVRDHMGRRHRQDRSRPANASAHWMDAHAQQHRTVAPLREVWGRVVVIGPYHPSVPTPARHHRPWEPKDDGQTTPG
eukprot:843360-Lingulodinium_polyedra.AAC.1